MGAGAEGSNRTRPCFSWTTFPAPFLGVGGGTHERRLPLCLRLESWGARGLGTGPLQRPEKAPQGGGAGGGSAVRAAASPVPIRRPHAALKKKKKKEKARSPLCGNEVQGRSTAKA